MTANGHRTCRFDAVRCWHEDTVRSWLDDAARTAAHAQAGLGHRRNRPGHQRAGSAGR